MQEQTDILTETFKRANACYDRAEIPLEAYEDEHSKVVEVEPEPTIAAPEPIPERLSFTLIKAGCIEAKAIIWMAKGLIESNTLALLFGDPGCGKSFIAIDLALCTATGTSFHGHDVEQGPVVYILGEGFSGVKRRAMAWSELNGISHDDAPLYFSTMPTALTEQEAVEAVTTAIDDVVTVEGNPVLVVIDTVARNFGPADENSTSEMSRFIQAADLIRTRYGATVLLVHHSGHGDKSRARGAIALKGALDAEYKVDKDDNGMIRLQATKMKEAELPEPLAFRLHSVDLPITDPETGEPVTSAALELTNYEPRAKQGKAGRGKHQTRALEILGNLCEQRFEAGVEEQRVLLSTWKNELHNEPDFPVKKINNIIRTLSSAGSIFITDDGFITLS